VLVVRAWMEGDPPLLKARITRTADVIAGERTFETASSPEEIVDCVRAWLDELAGDGAVTGG
jgi:hypothetical protein